MKKLVPFIFTMIALSACSATTGSPYSPVPIEKRSAQLVIYHPNELVGSVKIGSGPDVKINGEVVCSLPNGSFFITRVEPGAIHISSTKFLAVGTSTLDITTEANKRYFARITWNTNKILAGAVGGYVAKGDAYRDGPFVIESVDQQTANNELSSLNKVCE